MTCFFNELKVGAQSEELSWKNAARDEDKTLNWIGSSEKHISKIAHRAKYMGHKYLSRNIYTLSSISLEQEAQIHTLYQMKVDFAGFCQKWQSSGRYKSIKSYLLPSKKLFSNRLEKAAAFLQWHQFNFNNCRFKFLNFGCSSIKSFLII